MRFAALVELLEELRKVAPKVKWVHAENLHVTLKFLGEADAKKLGQIETTLRAIRSSQPVTLDFKALGFFPNEKRPFMPHLTLAHFNPPGLPPNLSAAAKQHSAQTFGSLVARDFHLVESKLKSTGAEYTTVQSFPFVSET